MSEFSYKFELTNDAQLFLHQGNDLIFKFLASEYDINTIGRLPEVVISTSLDQNVVKQLLDEITYLVNKKSEIHTSDIVKLYEGFKVSESYKELEVIRDVKGNTIKVKSYNQQHYIENIQSNDLVFGIGPAGTGKTFLAVCMAVKMLREKQVDKIIIARPAVEAGENLGFLPGDLKEKVDPYLQPIYDALNQLLGATVVERLIEKKEVEIAPLAYMRGRTLNDAFVILDEAQNTTKEQMKMFLTRLGVHSKMVITGDDSQIDLRNKKESGLVHATLLLKDVKGINVTRLEAVDVMRHYLVKRIITAYNNEKNKE